MPKIEIIYPDDSTWTIHNFEHPRDDVRADLITWRDEPSSITSHAPELATNAGKTFDCEWWGD